MRLLIVTDAFPPVCGGSGWSTYELAKGLRSRGHDVMLVRPRAGSDQAGAVSGPAPDEYDGFRPIEFPQWAPPVPFVRNYFKNERLYRALEAFLVDIIRRHDIDLVHAQHLMSGPASIAAARGAARPVVCTVRDYWPVCYWSDLILDRASDTLCPGCSSLRMTACVRPHAGAWWPLTLPAIPYMRANLALKRNRLAMADAVIAVSGALARELRARAPELAGTRVEIIHNPVDLAGMREQADAAPRPALARPVDGPYAVYVGKLEPNKGAMKLVPALERARLDWPLVVVGDGSERTPLEAAATTKGLDVRVTGWRPRGEVLAWLKHAGLLVFPSHGPESLSRVLLEASALGVPIAAMDTGGTADIVVDESTGLLSRTAEELGADVARLRADEGLRHRLGAAAQARVRDVFAADQIVARVERLYGELVSGTRSAH